MESAKQPESLQIELKSLADTSSFGHRLGQILQPGDVVALIGTLGAGKTHLSRALAEGMGLQESQQVCSPTFILMHVYVGRFPIYHFDTYRLGSEEEFEELGVREYMEGEGVCLIEWADKVPGCLPPDHLKIKISITGAESRQVDLEATGPRSRKIIAMLMPT